MNYITICPFLEERESSLRQITNQDTGIRYSLKQRGYLYYLIIR